jgi:hypothetical protein
MLARLIPIDREIQKASGALLGTKLTAVEIDFWDDDHFTRDGAIILLGESGDSIIGLTQRYYTDIKYPSVKLIPDGMGGAEIGNQYLDVYEDRDACKEKKTPEACRKQRFQIVKHQPERKALGNIVQAEGINDHDVTLLYFPKNAPLVSERPTMGVARPVEVVKRHVSEASHLFGFEYVMISKQALEAMRERITSESIGDKLMVAAASMVLGPMIGQLTSQIDFSKALVEKMNKQATELLSKKVGELGVALADALEQPSDTAGDVRTDRVSVFFPAKIEPKAKLSEPSVTPQGSLSLKLPKGAASVIPLGIVAPPAGEQADALASYLANVAVQADITLAIFGEEPGKERVMLLIQAEQVNLNYEILRHGFAKINVDDVEALKAFPELVQGAQAALDAGTGFARDWKSDGEYLAKVQSAAAL